MPAWSWTLQTEKNVQGRGTVYGDEWQRFLTASYETENGPRGSRRRSLPGSCWYTACEEPHDFSRSNALNATRRGFLGGAIAGKRLTAPLPAIWLNGAMPDIGSYLHPPWK